MAAQGKQRLSTTDEGIEPVTSIAHRQSAAFKCSVRGHMETQR
jgi:hypothetical protein